MKYSSMVGTRLTPKYKKRKRLNAIFTFYNRMAINIRSQSNEIFRNEIADERAATI